MRKRRIFRNIVIGLAAFLALLCAAVLIVLQTNWFRNYVRQEIVSQTEDATGGKVEMSTFDFNAHNVRNIRAVVTGFVIHGREPAGPAPFVQVAKAEVSVRLFPSLSRVYEIDRFSVERPQVNVIQMADGNTNIPVPKQKAISNKSALQTVVNLEVGRFDVMNGLIAVESFKQPLTIRGNNLLARLDYNPGSQSYKGEISLEPLYMVRDRNTPVNLRIHLPLSLERDRIDIRNGAVSTSASAVTFNVSFESVRDPKFSGHIGGHVGLTDIQNLANVSMPSLGRGLPKEMDVDVNATASSTAIDVTRMLVSLGQSKIEASGILEDPKGRGNFSFKTQVALNEMGRLFGLPARPNGVLLVSGSAALDAASNYLVTGNTEARNVSFQQGTKRVEGIQMVSALHIDPHIAALNGFRLTAFGGELTGRAVLREFRNYKLDGTLRNLDLQTVWRAAGQSLPYDGVLAGSVSAAGDTKIAGTRSLAGQASLSIVPGQRGIPVTGRLNANYRGDSDTFEIIDSSVNLPRTKLTLNGSTASKLNISLTSRDLNDLLAAVPLKGGAPVTLNGGQLIFIGDVSGGLTNPRVSGHLAANRFSAEGRQFDSLNANLAASDSQASVRDAILMRGPMQTQLSAAVGLKNWAAPAYEPVSADISVANGDLADVMALAGQAPAGYAGALSANAHIAGTIGNPQGTADLQVADGTVEGEPFGQIQARVNFTDQQIAIPVAWVESRGGRVDLKAEFRHPSDRFTAGQIHAHVQSTPMNLAEIRRVKEQEKSLSGMLQISADVDASVDSNANAAFLVTGATADLSGRELKLQGLDYGNLNGTARTTGQTLTWNLALDASTSTIRLNGNTKLAADYATAADASMNSFPIDHFLALANRRDIPARGNLSGTAHVDGTMSSPRANVALNLNRAVIYDEPIDSISARANYLDRSIELSRLEVVSGPARIALTGRFDHPANDLRQGEMSFDATSTQVDLGRIRNLQKIRPGTGGVLQMNARGAGHVGGGNRGILLTTLDARLAARGIKAQGKNLGDLTFTANSNNSSQVTFALDSNLAGASIRGSGGATLGGDYPVNGEILFSNVLYSRLQPLLGASASMPGFEAVTDGQVMLNGPVLKTDQLRGSVQLTRLNFTASPQPGAAKAVTISNQGPIAATLDRGLVRIQSARLAGGETTLEASGTAALSGETVDLTLNTNADLGILPKFDSDITSAGKITLTATVRGSVGAPLINGQVALNNAMFNYATIPNGISNANGVIALNGNSATVRNLTGESGGGKINVSGFVGYGGSGIRFGLRANANGVRVRPQQGVSIIAAADIRLTGTEQNSTVSGTVTVNQVSYNPQSDIGSILSRAGPPVESTATPSPLLANMKLDVAIKSSTGVTVQASLAQGLQADVDLQLRGTGSQPGLLGRITMNNGQLVFFGSTYTLDNGTVTFFNPIRIEPTLDIALETQTQGVHVTLRVTGPVDDMKLSYTSDPPLQFQEIVSLLAAGTTPTSDPTLLANQPQTPQQSFQQMGESAIVGKALADPVSNRLQRVFGVSQLKIDPSFQGGSQLPTARLTLQQRISSNLTFTYTSALDDPNGQIIRIDWALSPQFSAIANRDQNGIFSISFFYKRHFR
jgi:translocation and assembly module TamB